MLKYQEAYGEMDKMESTTRELEALGYNSDESEDEMSSAGGCEEDITHIGDDICLDDLTGYTLTRFNL